MLIILMLGIVIWRWSQRPDPQQLLHVYGTTMGTIGYNVKYIGKQPHPQIKEKIDSLLLTFNQSLSTYIPSAEISTFNRDSVFNFQSPYFLPVLKTSKWIFEESNGAFDPTVMPLVNAWGFGPDQANIPDSAKVTDLLAITGFDKIHFDDYQVWKDTAGVGLDFSAIAKGYAVDLVLEFVENLGYENIFVEIGGEVRATGTNEVSGKPWTVGIEDPTRVEGDRSIVMAAQLVDMAVATSGNYRNYRMLGSRKISHTIDPVTGYPVEHGLLSASVFARSCMLADGLATAIMVMGKDPAINLQRKLSDIEIFLIYSGEDGQLKTYASEGLEEVLLNH